MSLKTKPVAKPSIRARHLPLIKPGKYADGLPYDEIRYLECKLILKPNHFTSRASLFDFAKVLRRPAREHGVIFEPCSFTCPRSSASTATSIRSSPRRRTCGRTSRATTASSSRPRRCR